MDTVSDCCVCTETINGRQRKAVKCTSCGFDTCSTCVERYLETGNHSAQCMNCHTMWTYEYLVKTFGNASMKRIIASQKEVLFQQQRALFPSTQPYVAIEQERFVLDNEISELKKEVIRLNALIDEKRLLRYNGVHVFHQRSRDCEQPVSARQQYSRPCGVDDCKGFVLSDTGLCGLCGTAFCLGCNSERNERHECDPDDVLSVQLLKRDSKPCPSCSITIHRISGCPDMFCVDCHTAFNWNTLAINRTGNSNPHYYEWLRQSVTSVTAAPGGRGNDDTGGCATMRDVLQSCNNVAVSLAIRSIHHTINTIGTFYQATPHGGPRVALGTSFETVTLTLRIRFMRNLITEDVFKRNLMSVYKAIEFNQNIEQLKAVLIEHNQSMMNDVVRDDFVFKEWAEMYVRFAEYMNKSYHQLHEVFYASSKRELPDFIIISPVVRDRINKIS